MFLSTYLNGSLHRLIQAPNMQGDCSFTGGTNLSKANFDLKMYLTTRGRVWQLLVLDLCQGV
jgi:hypothetical protein